MQCARARPASQVEEVDARLAFMTPNCSMSVSTVALELEKDEEFSV